MRKVMKEKRNVEGYNPMRISELIEKLQETHNKHGDLFVNIKTKSRLWDIEGYEISFDDSGIPHLLIMSYF